MPISKSERRPPRDTSNEVPQREQNFASLSASAWQAGQATIQWVLPSGSRYLKDYHLIFRPAVATALRAYLSRHRLQPSAAESLISQEMVNGVWRRADDVVHRFKSPRRYPRNARNAAEIHGFCAAVPEVRIHLPPARSQQRTLWLPGGVARGWDPEMLWGRGRGACKRTSAAPRTSLSPPGPRLFCASPKR